MQAERELAALFDHLSTERRKNPGDDVISTLVAARDTDDITQQDLLATCELLLIAGFETTVNLIGKMITGSASSKHLSGPLTIAEQAGQSAHMGLAAYLSFLALISVSLGLLNLLPLPMLDGGHLMYYLWESLTGKPVSVAWQRGLQKVGLALLIFIMSLAFFNDLSRLFN
jgi:RIP metalloprotease RseP